MSQAKRITLAFSGGKDSLAMALIAASLGFRQAACEECFVLQCMKEDTRANAARIGLEVHYMDSLSKNWLMEHPRMLFAELPIQAKLYHARQQTSLARFAKANNTQIVVFGRRRQENTIKSPAYLKDGVWQCFPIFDWSHEDVWEFIHANGLPVPRIYATEYGQREGYAPWIGLERKFFPKPWQTIFEMQPEIVAEHSDWNAEAAETIKRNNS